MKKRGYNQGQGEKLTLERRMIYVFSAMRKEMNNDPEKSSSSEAKKSSKLIAAKARSPAESDGGGVEG